MRRLLSLGILLGLCSTVWQGVAQERWFQADPSQPGAYYVAGELVVGLSEYEPNALARQAMVFTGYPIRFDPATNTYVVRLARGIDVESARQFLSLMPGVRYAEPNYLASVCNTPNDPRYSGQYALQRIQAHLAWTIWNPQSPTHIAIVDTGIDYNHPDLSQKMRRRSDGSVYGYNAITNTPNAWDDHGHGTHCAGIAGGHINNGVGIAGVAGWNPSNANAQQFVQLMPVKVLTAQGYGTFADVARGITWAVDNGARIISLSLGATVGNQQIADAVNYAWNRGCLVVAAAGNNGTPDPFYPAYYERAIAVAASDMNDRLTEFSQYGSWVDIAAPGLWIDSTVPNGWYEVWSGTSMATPHVAGVAALIWSQAPNLTNQQVRQLIETQTDPYLPFEGRQIAPGAGRLNAYRALSAAPDSTHPIQNLTLSQQNVAGGQSLTGTVTLASPAGSGGVSVALSTSHSNIVGLPATVTVPSGARQANFTITTQRVGTPTSVQITATVNGRSRSVSLTVTPSLRLRSLQINPASVRGGLSATGTLELSEPAPSGGVVIPLSHAVSGASVNLPNSITVPQGQTRAQFTIQTQPVSQPATLTVSASLNGSQVQATLQIQPPAIQMVSLSPATTMGGRSVLLQVRLNGPAPAGGLYVQLSTTHPDRTYLPRTLYIPSGSSSATIQFGTTRGRGIVRVTITAQYLNSSRSAVLTLRN
ncbi:MAG: S8 family serine peptidase [Fimbriimonadales bacterium]